MAFWVIVERLKCTGRVSKEGKASQVRHKGQKVYVYRARCEALPTLKRARNGHHVVTITRSFQLTFGHLDFGNSQVGNL